MTSLAEAFGLGRGCFGREGVLRCTGTFPETGRLPSLRSIVAQGLAALLATNSTPPAMR